MALAGGFNLPHVFEISLINCWSVPYSVESYDVCPSALSLNETYNVLYYMYAYTGGAKIQRG